MSLTIASGGLHVISRRSVLHFSRRCLTTSHTALRNKPRKQDLPVRQDDVGFIVPKRIVSPSVYVDHTQGDIDQSLKSRLFAVFAIGGKQYKVTPGDIVMTPHLKRPDIGSKLRIESVLLIGGLDFSIIGQPHVQKSAVIASVQEHTQTGKIIVFKKKRRQGYRRTRGHRTDVSILKIDDIELNAMPNDSITTI